MREKSRNVTLVFGDGRHGTTPRQVPVHRLSLRVVELRATLVVLEVVPDHEGLPLPVEAALLHDGRAEQRLLLVVVHGRLQQLLEAVLLLRVGLVGASENVLWMQ